MKTTISAALGLALLAPTAQAEDNAKQRFEHEGHIYSYSITRKGDMRLITGIEERSGKRFRLRIGERRVRGTVGSQQVNFPLRDVEPLDTAPTTLAAR
ncbi:hypothetical protein [Sphingopyxis flava]|uniref:Uncharacterized protein n=1 Tax=Sphingopyxis flava TaxID=1507287 RepID=A0A1T5DFW5_9SPHN|nr:hypothetical protein [Sphingopyxis flava]SKB70604.1 hypothetical protein SAMN06295937_101463 [Sphingopyxis flava]